MGFLRIKIEGVYIPPLERDFYFLLCKEGRKVTHGQVIKGASLLEGNCLDHGFHLHIITLL